MKSLNHDEKTSERKDRLIEQKRKLKEENREMIERLREVEKVDKNAHSKVIDTEENLRRLKRALKIAPNDEYLDDFEPPKDIKTLAEELSKM